MPNIPLEDLKDYPILTRIEKFKQTTGDEEVIAILDLLLEALAQESSGGYGGGFFCMEEALGRAQGYLEEQKNPKPQREYTPEEFKAFQKAWHEAMNNIKIGFIAEELKSHG